MPNIPTIDPGITLTTTDSLNVILMSIGLEELGLAHIINAEGEKMQAFLGTLKKEKDITRENEEEQETECKPVSIDDLQKLDNMVNETLNSISKKELILLMKLESTLAALKCKE